MAYGFQSLLILICDRYDKGHVNRTAKTSLFLSILLILIPGAGFAAVSGQLADKSEGTIQVSLSILPAIRIDTVNNINLRIDDRNIDTSFTEKLCISGNLDGKYNLTAQGSSSNANHFTLKNSDQGELIYHVAYRGNSQSQQ